METTVQRSSHLSIEQMRSLYRLMVVNRLFNERATLLQRQGRIHSFLGNVGQEAAQLGTAYALRPEDWVFPAYREHIIPLLRGIPVKRLFDHMFGNAADTVLGRNLPPEYSFKEVNYNCNSAPIGNQIVHAVGAAYAAKIRRDPVVSMVYFGDGASSSSDFHVGLNFAGVWQTPTVFVCQNNGWAISVPTAMQTASETIAQKAFAYGFEGIQVDGNDVVAVYEAASRAVEKARTGGGPTLIEALTYRIGPHSTSDDPSQYRDAAEVEVWKQKDPIDRLKHTLKTAGGWDEAWAELLWADAKQEVADAAAASEKEPAPSLETIFSDVYQMTPWHLQEQYEEATGRR